MLIRRQRKQPETDRFYVNHCLDTVKVCSDDIGRRLRNFTQQCYLNPTLTAVHVLRG